MTGDLNGYILYRLSRAESTFNDAKILAAKIIAGTLA